MCSVAPFTRGSTLRTGTIHAWDVSQLHEDPDAAYSNAAALADLANGATSLLLRVDPDAIAAADVGTVLKGVLPELAPISVYSRTDQAAAAAALADFWRASSRAVARPMPEAARVASGPGEIAWTRIPLGPSSAAR